MLSLFPYSISGASMLILLAQGLDLDRLAARKRFAFVDGLSGLYLSTQAGHARDGQRVLSSPSPKAVSAEIQQAIESLNAKDDSGRVFLVIDQLDLLLATDGEGIGSVEVGELLLELREVCTPLSIQLCWGLIVY
jgi:elongator complex protein 6